jgi:hypothetical protein
MVSQRKTAETQAQIAAVKDEPVIVAKPVRTKRVRVNRTETFIEPVTDPEANEPEIGEVDDDPEEDEVDEYLSDVEIILRDGGNEAQYTMRVDRLPNYAEDGRSDTRAEKEYCTSFTPTVDFPKRIQREFGGGTYLISLYERGRGIIMRRTEHIAQPLREEVPAVAAPVVVAPLAPPAPPVDTLDTFSTQASKLAGVMESLGFKRPDATEKAAVATTAAPPADPTEQFLNNLDKYTTISERLAPSREARGGRSIIGDIADLVREVGTHGRTLAPLLATMIAPPYRVAQPQPRQQPRPPSTTQPNPATHDAAEAAPTEQEQHPFNAVLQILVDDITANAPNDRAVDAIDDLYEAHPELEATIEPLWDLEANELVAALAQMTGAHYILKMPHSLAWAEGLKKVFNDAKNSTAVAGTDGDAGAVQEPA